MASLVPRRLIQQPSSIVKTLLGHRSIAMIGNAAVPSSPVIIKSNMSNSTKFDVDEYDTTGAGRILHSLPTPSARCMKAGAGPYHGLSGTRLGRDVTEMPKPVTGIARKHTNTVATQIDVTADLYGEDFNPGCWIP